MTIDVNIYSKKFRLSSNTFLWILVGFLTFLGFILRIIRLTHSGVWLDETYTLLFARVSLKELAFRQLHGEMQNPPIYHLFMHYWIRFFGISSFSLRFPSVVFSTLLLPVTFFTLRQWKIPFHQIAVTLFLFALSPSLIYYAQEARAYSLVFFLLMTSLWLFSTWYNHQKNSILYLYILTSLFSFFTSLWSVFWFAGFSLWILWAWWNFPDKKSFQKLILKKWIMGQVIPGLFIIFYVAHMLLSKDASPYAKMDYNLNFGDSYRFFVHMGLGVFIPIPNNAYIFAGSVLSIGLFIGIFRYFHITDINQRNFLKMVLILTFLPFILLIILSFKLHVFYPDRYGIFCLPGFLMLVGYGLSELFSKKSLIYIGILLMVFFTIGISQSIRADYQFQKVHLREIVKFIQQYGKPEDAVILAPGFWGVNYDYYDKSNRPRVFINSKNDLPNPGQYSRAWYIDIPYTPPDPVVIQQLNRMYSQKAWIYTFSPYYITLYLYSNQ